MDVHKVKIISFADCTFNNRLRIGISRDLLAELWFFFINTISQTFLPVQSHSSSSLFFTKKVKREYVYIFFSDPNPEVGIGASCPIPTSGLGSEKKNINIFPL